MAQNLSPKAGDFMVMAGETDGFSQMGEDFLAGEIQAKTPLTLSDTHCFHGFRVSNEPPTLKHCRAASGL
jgi:hypothetical protein